MPIVRRSDTSDQVMRWFQSVTIPHECNLEELDGISGKDLATLVESGDLLETLVEDVGLKKAKAKSLLRTLEKMFPGGRKAGGMSMHAMNGMGMGVGMGMGMGMRHGHGAWGRGRGMGMRHEA